MAFRTIQVANLLGVDARTIRNLAVKGELKGHKHTDGRHWLFEKEDLAHFIIFHDEYFSYLLIHKPKPIYQGSYNILLKEIRRIA